MRHDKPLLIRTDNLYHEKTTDHSGIGMAETVTQRRPRGRKMFKGEPYGLSLREGGTIDKNNLIA